MPRQTAIKAEVGRIGVNGTKACLVEDGTTVEELLDQAGYELDEDKESVIAQSTGLTVDLDDEVENGETYVLSPEVKSA